ncbi:hypothetical protein ACHWQZ_G018797 [Mnemiopsis leidyi]
MIPPWKEEESEGEEWRKKVEKSKQRKVEREEWRGRVDRGKWRERRVEGESRQMKVEKEEYFFSYAERFAECKNLIGPLKTASNILTKNPKEMADLLQKQYMSVLSDQKSKLKKVPIHEDPLDHGLDNIDFTCDDITEAIKEIDVNAASCPDDIPAKVLNKCSEKLPIPSPKSGLSPLKKVSSQVL